VDEVKDEFNKMDNSHLEKLIKTGRSALHDAARYSKVELVRYLLEGRETPVAVDRRGEEGMTALHYVCRYLHPSNTYAHRQFLLQVRATEGALRRCCRGGGWPAAGARGRHQRRGQVAVRTSSPFPPADVFLCKLSVPSTQSNVYSGLLVMRGVSGST
jgi:hypothetical protein